MTKEEFTPTFREGDDLICIRYGLDLTRGRKYQAAQDSFVDKDGIEFVYILNECERYPNFVSDFELAKPDADRG